MEPRFSRDEQKIITSQLPNIRGIPYEIVDEILSRLPIKSLLRFKCVCKRWLSVISNPDFKKRESGSILLTVSSHNTHTFYIIDDDKAVVDNAFSAPWINDKRCYMFNALVSNSYNGLVLICFDESLFLFNPSTSYFVKVLTLDHMQDNCYSVRFGLCYDEHINDYKAVVMLAGESRYACRFVLAASLKTKEWTRVSFPSDFRGAREGPVVNGLMHWTVHESTDDKFAAARKIIRFDPQTNM